jgi:hypothetical protein
VADFGLQSRALLANQRVDPPASNPGSARRTLSEELERRA